MSKIFKHILALLVVVAAYGIIGTFLQCLCIFLEQLGWDTKSNAAMITGILFGYSIEWLERKSNEF